MASKLALSLVIGGAVSSTMASAFRTVEGHIKKLEDKGSKAKVLKSTIGETIRLRDEWKRAHDSGAASADGLLRKLNGNLDALRKQGVEVGRLGQEYQRLGRAAKAADLQLKGHQQLDAGKKGLTSSIGQGVVATGLAAIPTKVSADYQAIIRDIAIKADVVNKPQETQLSQTVIQTSRDTGMARNDVADLVNQLVGAGMDLKQAMAYAPTAAKFAIGQGASGVDTASMIMALQQNAKINDPKVMQQALEAIAYQGQAGSFEASDMARWFPQLLASMEKNGSTGMEAVSSLGAMLQVQMKTAGGSDEAANNLKNWMEKIGSGDVVKAYKDAGIDYQASLNTGIQKGMSTLESSFALAMKYIQATDPAKAAKMAEAQAKISKETDPEKAKAALDALEKSLRTGDLFADMQVKAALTAYSQNKSLYEQLKKDSQSSGGILDKNLAERRETSKQMWDELGQAVSDGMRSVGDAIRPATDAVAQGLTSIVRGLTKLSDGSQPVVLGIAAITAGLLALKTTASAVKIGKGLYNISRGRAMERGAGALGGAAAKAPKTGIKTVDKGLGVLGKLMGGSSEAGSEPQRVFVVNADAIGRASASGPGTDPGGAARKRQRGRRGRRSGIGAMPRKRMMVRAPSAPAVAAPAMPSLPKASALSALPKAAAVAALPMAAVAEAVPSGSLGQAVKSIRGVTRLSKRVPGGSVLDAGVGALDTALNATTQDEKAEGYGSAAGGLAGALAGGAAGAAIGSVVPIIGTAIGGAIGAALGGLGGESIGGFLGKSWFGSDDKVEDAKADKPAASTDAPTKPPEVAKVAEPTPPVPPKVEQAFSFAPQVSITVQGDVKDPAQLARDLEPHLRQLMESFSRDVAARQASSQLFDSPHV
ncbi:phage tail tape measure protein [Pseudomonas thivervalensis]|uniref:phage tail tape measure protein n=1 Tax=Pseudomonas thivervalensis TaxID=86265 RepID=UPI00069E4478|nr:phage tail tape measure protein [Pseudomonas thivervalensis]OAB54146.1 phage tail protein [Pseudomonas thivervalensis]SDG41396.1 phage tail tape measure protein, TP901 family, core region [Pseudomonas thivervalensis]